MESTVCKNHSIWRRMIDEGWLRAAELACTTDGVQAGVQCQVAGQPLAEQYPHPFVGR